MDYIKRIYETISFGKSEKVPLRTLVLKAGYYLKFQENNHWISTEPICLKHRQPKYVPNSLNNSVVDGLQSETINSLDATYVFRSAKSEINGLLFDDKKRH
jgi:hypothetical protein